MSMQTKNISNKKPKRPCLLASAVAFAVAMPSLTNAQDSFLEEIVVTARKVEENLQSTPVAVSAFTEESLERRMITGTEDLSRITPNLQFKSYSPLSGNSSAAQVFIRGVGQSDSSGGVDPGVGMYIDDVYMGRSVGGVLDFRDISNVQVLRGPQGTLFGRNTIGGAVLLSTTAPGSEFGGKVKFGVGSDSLREFFGAVDLPFSDSVAARVSLGSRERDGYVERIFDGLDLGNEDSYTLNGSLHIDPMDGLNFVIRADYTEEEENGSPFVFAAINENGVFPAAQSVREGCPGATFPPPSVPSGLIDQRCANNATWDLGEYKNGGNSRAESNVENSGYSFHANWDVSDLVSLKYIYADRSLEWDGSRDADNTYLTLLSTQYESEADQTSHELQALFQSESFHGVVGAFFFDENVHDFLLVPFGPPGGYPAGTVPFDYQDADLNNKSTAYFTQWSFNITDALSLTAGARYTDEDKTMRIISISPGVVPIPVTGEISVPVPAGPFIVPYGPHKESFDATTLSLSGQYQFTDTLMAYLSWSEGFKSGGFNQRYNATPPGGNVIPFDSEEATTIEVGFKADLTDSLRLNAAIFDTNYENMQLTYRVGIVPLLFNAGESSIRGAEVEFTFAPTAEFILEGSLGYLDDEIDSISVIPGATATIGPNNSLPFTPEYTASIGAAYTFNFGDLALTPRLDVSYTDEQFFDAANSVEVAQNNAETVVNFSLKFGDAGDLWNVVAGIDNVRDETYAVAGNSSLGTSSGYAEVIYSRPRTAYISATVNF
ncbi:TonB-dependent receptor [Aurantivibrio infirmus]